MDHKLAAPSFDGKDEAVAVWGRDFFERDGRRFLLILSPEDYNTLCPIRVNPSPASLHRVGVILTELSPP